MMNNNQIVLITVVIIMTTLALFQRPMFKLLRNRRIESSLIDIYAHSRLLPVHGLVDPACSRTKNVYVCAGICPWSNTQNNERISCSFLPLDSSQQEFRTSDTWPANWTVEFIEKYRKQVRARESYGSYSSKDIYPALDKYASVAIVNKACAVIGTENPWIEAALLEYNASSVTTIEYATIYSNTPRLYTIKPMDFARKQSNRKQRQLFDSVWSYSSIEHDGLGRYRDPLNPYGDFQTMIKITCILKPGGLLFLSVPLNTQDFIQFNLHRIYGPIRLPLLYRHFHVVEVLGLGMQKNYGDFTSQPFVVLQNKIGCKKG
ncbi:unnamed protein product [Rotaria magnacalcarata]|uniref:Methyltransferase type 11 domain-containing protein n=1 Tax=Rotaria magnacalcarata TaxID=392030 RepID=A0A816ZH66_9BILA|nr:unnamed protein product [Rotaria magnacalcarata]